MPAPLWRIGLAFTAIYLIWGSTFLATRFAVQALPPFFVAGFRFFLGGLVLYVIGRSSSREPLTRTHWLNAAKLGILFFFLCHGAVSWAAQHVPSGVAALLMASIALWTAVVERFLQTHTKPGRRVLLSLAGGFIGLAVLVLKPESLAGSTQGRAASLAVLFGALTWAIATVVSSRSVRPQSNFTSAGMQMLCGGGALILLSCVLQPPSFERVTAVTVWSIAYLTIVGALVGFLSYTYLLQHVPPTKVATYAYVNPVVALLLGWALAGETISARSLIASLFVLAAVANIVLSRSAPVPPRRPTSISVPAQQGA
jgi:drug/metabolite transporter (DMT)-like permease